MSKSQTYNITCPSCGEAQDAMLYQFIDASENSDLRQALMENRLNRITCDSCETSFRIDTPLLYSDPANDMLIHWVPETKELSREKILEDFDESLEELSGSMPDDIKLPAVRLVLTRVELVELIFMIEENMNHRVVEYVKYSMYTRNPEKIPPAKYRLLLNVQDSTEEELCFVLQNVETQELETGLRYGRSAYESMCDLFKESPDEFLDMFPGPCISARNLLLDETLTEEV